ncbi:MAG: response regulator transcription factor [Sedimentisphaerales bacterium]|nr:response regulator transcription factor [Sedimentisphaerales bacterium]
MPSFRNRNIFFVDDEPKVREVVGETLEQLGSKVRCFAKASECLEQIETQRCDLLITDVKMPEMNGIELLIKAKRIAPWLPVLIVTGYGDIPTAVTAVKAGAVDFIEKPLETETFLRKVKSLLKHNSVLNFIKDNPLTRSEIKILRLVIEGKSSKEIANILHRSIRTVEVHRSGIMHKLGVDNLVDLVKRAAAMGLIDLLDEQKTD